MSTLKLYDTATRSVREFAPIKKGEVSIYVCGATVQNSPHIGHVRSGINFDILRRWLIATGNKVTFIRNITDIDDKILHRAIHEEMPWWALAMKYERAFADAYSALNVLPPTYEPRATGHITQMIDLMEESTGVSGLHLNGEEADWDWLLNHHWLPSMELAMAIAKEAEEEFRKRQSDSQK